MQAVTKKQLKSSRRSVWNREQSTRYIGAMQSWHFSQSQMKIISDRMKASREDKKAEVAKINEAIHESSRKLPATRTSFISRMMKRCGERGK